MGFPVLIMLFLAAFIIAVSVNHLFLAFRLRTSAIHLYVSIAGTLGAAWFIMVFFGYTAPIEGGTLLRIYRYHLLFMQLAILFLVFAYSLMAGFERQRWWYVLFGVFIVLSLATLVLPEKSLFTSSPAAAVTMIAGWPVTFLESSLVNWRLLADISVVSALFFILSFILRQMTTNPVPGKAGAIVLAALFLVFGAFDHLTDAGTFAMIYLLPVGYFVSFSMISSASLAATLQDMRKSYRILQEDRKWRLMAQEMKLLIVELNTLGQVKFVNPFFYELTGYKKEEVLGKDWFEMALPKSHTYEVQSTFIEILSNDFHPHYENPILTKNQQEKMISWYNVRTRDAKGKITGSISIGIDISESNMEKESLEKELEKARGLVERLKREIETRGR